MIKNNINGWLIIDKPLGMGSTDAVTKIKRLIHPQKIGHAGTLDPLASGVLPIALGIATKTIPFVMDGKKTYIFETTWGSATTTDDKEGEVICQSDKRPSLDEVEKILPAFTGDILQTPPAYSALKINGKRAYDLARKGEEVSLAPRKITVDSLKILAHDGEKTTFEVVCSKGTYVRSLGREMGIRLGCYGHISLLRRTKCGPFDIKNSILLENLEKDVYNGATLNLISVLTALDDILVLAVGEKESKELAFGKAIRFNRIADPKAHIPAQQPHAVIGLTHNGQLIALAKNEDGFLKPFRVFADKV